MKARRSHLRTVLTVAGSDSGGGAGIQADLKTFASLGVHGTSAITCLTAQDPSGVRGVQACHPGILRQQIEAVFETFHPNAVKTGMLYSIPLITTVAQTLHQLQPACLVVDPVMVATSGARLLQPSAIRALCRDLLPLATLITPNLDEAAVLLNRPLTAPEALRAAARELHERFGCAALVKGGHLRETKLAVDFFYDGRNELLFEAPRIPRVSTHGTGCTYSAAIAGYAALGCRLPYAVELAKQYITNAIAQSARAGSHSVLNHFWE
ncbi:MAG: bifunctional hydroxymethylpyrimidine kinase/phosphomethylpyrimidine kinase [Verrucomicrobia bacterium]|nr:bifunctional hydroxymethylpyrimidine kinase/phosphomethylpyrimidine kinase [Verrucomicrobiota bacterium]